MSYITKNDVEYALANMKRFHEAQRAMHANFDMDFLGNRGRRNTIMSAAQESCFAQALSRRFNVIKDGRTGQSDIFIQSINTELECKMTSPYESTGAVVFSTDYETLKAKGKLDYLYVIADEEFQKFCVLHFVGLTPDDYRDACNSSRGKSVMIKSKGMPKCTVLWGEVETQIDRAKTDIKKEIEKTYFDLGVDIEYTYCRRKELEATLAKDVHSVTGEKLTGQTRYPERAKLKRLINRPDFLAKRAEAKVNRLITKMEKLQDSKPRYSFIMKPI